MLEELGCNIVRCWGGNVYEDHAFFDFCDSAGILVWQDFAFACALYPQDEAFFAEVRAKARAVIRKLRNHASLALWAGDNEIDIFAVFLEPGSCDQPDQPLGAAGDLRRRGSLSPVPAQLPLRIRRSLARAAPRTRS